MGPVVRALSENSHNVSFKVCVTSQHREMAEEALRIFDIRPDYDVNVMTGDQTPTQVAAAVLERIEPVLRSEEPDWVLVQGDTTSVTAASLAAFYCRVRVGHVEAGLRTHNRLHPFPEEVHRRIVGTTADLHFAPTARARSELLKEGVAENDIVLTGNPIVDAVQWVASMRFDRDCLPACRDRSRRKILLVTAHRRENVESGTARIVGSDRERIVSSVRRLIENRDEYSVMSHATNPYGDGKAAKRIVNALLERAHRERN